MPRHKDDGLKYFPFDVTFFRDPKIRSLRGKYGHKGVMVYLYLLTEIYGGYGYYLPLDDDLISFTADDLNISEDLTRQVIAHLFSRSLLDGKLAESVKALSAKSVQRRYQEAKKGLKRDVVVEAKYWLLEKDETLSFIKVRPENGFSWENEDNSGINDGSSGKKDTKESKSKESKLKESKEGSPPSASLAEEKRKILTEEYGSSAVEAYEQKFERWRASKHALNADAFLCISKWLQQDKPGRGLKGNSSFCAEDVEKAVKDKYRQLKGEKDDGKV